MYTLEACLLVVHVHTGGLFVSGICTHWRLVCWWYMYTLEAYLLVVYTLEANKPYGFCGLYAPCLLTSPP